MEEIESIHKQFIKHILPLSDTVADPAVFILPGAVPLEVVIYKKSIDVVWKILQVERGIHGEKTYSQAIHCEKF